MVRDLTAIKADDPESLALVRCQKWDYRGLAAVVR
jgi:hypothetical protein